MATGHFVNLPIIYISQNQTSKYQKMAETKKCALIRFIVANFLYFTKKIILTPKKYKKVAFLRIMSKLAVICIFKGQKWFFLLK